MPLDVGTSSHVTVNAIHLTFLDSGTVADNAI
jgi:hypothetical protein